LEDLEPDFEDDLDFDDDLDFEDDFLGTFAPSFLASDKPIAIALFFFVHYFFNLFACTFRILCHVKNLMG
jgi:hypothetical protein